VWPFFPHTFSIINNLYEDHFIINNVIILKIIWSWLGKTKKKRFNFDYSILYVFFFFLIITNLSKVILFFKR